MYLLYFNILGYSYEGAFKNDLFNGNGTLIYPNGYKWEGKFQNGLPEGKGNNIFLLLIILSVIIIPFFINLILGSVTINTPLNPSQKKTTFVAAVKERDVSLAFGKEDVKFALPPDAPVFELDV